MSRDRNGHIELLTAITWDVRASAEAQIRALTALQRCADDYRRTHDLDALNEIERHLADVERRAAQVRDSLTGAATAVESLKATHD